MLTTSKNFKPDITCIYVNYHSADFLKRSLVSLFQLEQDTTFEIIIVNNDPSEQKKIEEIGNEFQALVISSPDNSFSRACNKGAAQATGELLFFINPDTQWKKRFFKNIQREFLQNKKVGVVGIQLTSPEGIPEKRNRGASFGVKNIFTADKKIDWVSGGALFIPRHIFLCVGGFDERFFLYFEDMDLCMRVKKEGYHILFTQEQSLVHFGGQSHTGKKSQKKHYDRSLYQYAQKYWPHYQYVLFRLIHPCYRFLFPYGRN